jgi:hypothetical protein
VPSVVRARAPPSAIAAAATAWACRSTPPPPGSLLPCGPSRRAAGWVRLQGARRSPPDSSAPFLCPPSSARSQPRCLQRVSCLSWRCSRSTLCMRRRRVVFEPIRTATCPVVRSAAGLLISKHGSRSCAAAPARRSAACHPATLNQRYVRLRPPCPTLLPRRPSTAPPSPTPQIKKESEWYNFIKELDRQRARGVQVRARAMCVAN